MSTQKKDQNISFRFDYCVKRHPLTLQIKFLNPLITRKPKLRRQRKIFRQQGKMPRPEQMNINVATWGRLLKRNINLTKSLPVDAAASRQDQQQHNANTAGRSRFCHCEKVDRRGGTKSHWLCEKTSKEKLTLKYCRHMFRWKTSVVQVVFLNLYTLKYTERHLFKMHLHASIYWM